MKNIVFYIVFLIISTTHPQAQEFDMGDVMETAMDFVEEAQGGAETQADNQSMGQMVDKLLKKTDDPAFKALIENLSQALKEFENESYTGKCLQVMGAYAEALAYADRRVELAGNACEKKEWLGIEGLLLLTGGTINYCPTEFYGLSDEILDENEQREVILGYEQRIKNYFFGPLSDNEILLKAYEHASKKATSYAAYEQYVIAVLEQQGKSFESLSAEQKDYLKKLWEKDHGKKFDDKIMNEFPHLELYKKFENANEQLDIKTFTQGKKGSQKEISSMVDFVGKMFTPEFMLTKTVEIAKLSNLYKCSN
ncbi:hypothetical protein [Flagellimonas marinaquae]|uniref:hypothetical protein n=1 Tax=Flagellimonas marinaquae TaxID=254955 RepID=UPI002075C912|nr:hypothetical protein [Allomuricauda aquimarina]USD26094.1 hypothetical protein MJO53_04175 [Allomuricauda aquimarina]